MKKTIILLSFILAYGFTYSQDLTSKRGLPILPEANDWAIGFDGSPLFNYFGNAFNNSTGNAFAVNFVDATQTIYGKKFKDANNAYRAQLRIGFGSENEITEVNDLTDTSGTAMVENKMSDSYTAITLGVGCEKRRGNTRLQGVYGTEVLIGFEGSSTSYKYGNSIELELAGGGQRTMKVKNGTTFNLGARAFIGAEYFIAPKLSIGVEYGFAFGLSTTGYAKTTVEDYISWQDTVEEVETSGGSRSSSFALDTDNTGGSIRLMLHF